MMMDGNCSKHYFRDLVSQGFCSVLPKDFAMANNLFVCAECDNYKQSPPLLPGGLPMGQESCGRQF